MLLSSLYGGGCVVQAWTKDCVRLLLELVYRVRVRARVRVRVRIRDVVRV